MNQPRNTEAQANFELARALRRRNPDWNATTVHAERTRVIHQAAPGSGTGAGMRPDILIDSPHRQPVIVETEFAPAPSVERDAAARLGTALKGSGTGIEGVLAVILPGNLRTGDLEAINDAPFRYATYCLDSGGSGRRWPAGREWLDGGVDDLADAIEYLSLSERQLALGTEVLERVVSQASYRLAERATDRTLGEIARTLHQEPGKQTERMAAAICVSACVFHAAIEGRAGIPPLPLKTPVISKIDLLRAWDEILRVNYYPIFGIARDVVAHMPIKIVWWVMEPVAAAMPELTKLGATTYHDLTGRMFQTLIADRKFLATFYTLPPSACLLAELAVDRLGVDWADRSAIEDLRIADFACGTGALLSATQRAVYRRCRRAGGDDKLLHKAMMERVLVGLDIMPAATHLTCSMLSSTHPSLVYGESRIHTVPYGINGGRTHIGALDFLDSEHSFSLFATGESLGGRVADSRSEHSVTIKDCSCDLVIMNPPFTRPTNHEAHHADIPVPSFAGFNTSHEEQEAMRRKLRRSGRAFGSGHAGLASNFMDLAHRKLKEGGVLAAVLPFAFVSGMAWKGARETLAGCYEDLHVTSIAATGGTASAFSADTGMAECLVVATKRAGGSASTMYSNLAARPATLLEAAVEARIVAQRAMRGDIREAGAAGIRSTSVIEVARELASGSLRLPRQAQAIELPIVPLGAVAERGLVHRDISGGPTDREKTGPPQGPFVVRATYSGEVPTYPMLWAHSAKHQRTFVVQPDRCGVPREGDEERASERWNRKASRLHSNLDFRLNSQSLAMCLTAEKCLGGTAWPNVIPHEQKYEMPLLLWSNSTPGLILFWWQGTRQQQGRARITITKLPDLPVLDPRPLTEEQTDRCCAIFEDFKDRAFLPANEAYRDTTRKALDCALLFGRASVLQLDPGLEEELDLLRDQWCAEPSVHGGKRTGIDVSGSVA